MDQQVIDHARQLQASLDAARTEATAFGASATASEHGFVVTMLQLALEEFLRRLGQQG